MENRKALDDKKVLTDRTIENVTGGDNSNPLFPETVIIAPGLTNPIRNYQSDDGKTSTKIKG